MALAKITTDEICVTDKIDADSLSHAEVRQTADSAPEKVCLEPLPHITVDGVIIR